MDISFFTDCLLLVVRVFRMFPPLLWLLCCAIICSIAYIIKSIVNLRG